MFQAGEGGQHCPRRRRSPAENKEEFGGPKRLEGLGHSNCGRKSEYVWKT